MSANKKSIARRFIAGGLAAFMTSGMLLATSVGATAQDAPEGEGLDANGYRVEAPEFGGFNADGRTTPITIQMFEPVIPVPVDPGNPHGEIAGNFTRAIASTGPTSRALASAVWPGATVGDGLNAACGDCGANYPFKADARYPDGPFEHFGAYPDDPSQTGSPEGNGMNAYAHGLDVYALSTTTGDLIPGLVKAGNVISESWATVEGGIVSSVNATSISDLSIADTILFEGFEARLSSQSNGEVASTDGQMTLSGLSIAGVEFVITDTGIVAKDPNSGQGFEQELPGGQEINYLDLIGITVEAATYDVSEDGPTAERSTTGTVIRIDSSPLKAVIDETGLSLNDIIGNLPDEGAPLDFLPEEITGNLPFECSDAFTCAKANLYTLSTLAPEMRIIIGAGSVSTTAAPTFNFELPALPPPPAITPPSTGASIGSSTLPSVSLPPVDVAPPAADVAPPAAAPPAAPAQQPVAAGFTMPEPTPVNAAIVVLAGLGTLLMAQGLTMLSAQVVGPMAGPASASSVPDLRKF